MRTYLAGLNQSIKFIRVIWNLVRLKDHQFPATRNYGRPALERVVGKLAQGTLGLAQSARFHGLNLD